MTVSAKPTILLLHGCFSNPATFDRFVPYLERAGYPTVRATFPSVDPENPLDATAQKDIDHVRQSYLLPLIENAQDPKDIILLAHSYGGVVGGAAATGLSKTTRSAQGLKGGVVGVIFIAVNIVHENKSLLESFGEPETESPTHESTQEPAEAQWPPWFKADEVNGTAVIEPLMETLCQDCDPSLEPEVRKGSSAQGYRCLVTPASAPCWAEEAYAGRLAYVHTTQDRINPVSEQERWVKGTGVRWDVVTMDTSHVPYLSQPERLAAQVVEFSAKFESL